MAACHNICRLAVDCGTWLVCFAGRGRTWKSDRLPPPVLSTSRQRGFSVLSSTCSIGKQVSA
jgi:hypothetical protein